MAWGDGGSRAWRRVVAFVLERDDHQCQLRYAGCTGVATQGDHRIHLASLGITRNDPAALDPDNVQAACAHCHNVKSRREQAAAAAKAGRARSEARRARLRLPAEPHPGD